MLKGVDYAKLKDDCTLAELESTVAQNLLEFISGISTAMLEVGVLLTPKLAAGYLSAYLGFLTVRELGKAQARHLTFDLEELIGTQAECAYDMFDKYPLHVGSEKLGIKNLVKLRKAAGGIVDRTLEICALVSDVTDALEANYKAGNPQVLSPFSQFFISRLTELDEKSAQKCDSFVINQTAVQIGWLVGHCARLESKDKDTVLHYMLYVIASLKECTS